MATNLKRTFDYKAGRTYSVASAVECECDGTDYDRGSVETAEATARNTMRFLGRLVETLHEKELLTNGDVLKLLEGSWEIV